MIWTRRTFVRAGAVFLGPFLAACTTDSGDDGGGDSSGDGDGDGDGDGLPVYEYDGTPGPESMFSHGVASGDPLPDAVMLWTRVSPEEAADTEIFVEVALDPAFTQRVAAGYYMALAAADLTFKLDVIDLEPGTTYYYRFYSLGRTSPIGRTRTAPVGAVDRLRFGMVSCSNYTYGYFHAYRALAERPELAAIIHLGDYIYEYAVGEYGTAGEVRDAIPDKEIVTLSDYRQRYAQYRTDPDLQEAHRQHPFIVVWDDHECTDNGYKDGAANHTEGTEGTWVERLAASKQAYAEWLPIREMVDGEIYRVLRYGDLADLIMLDTRITGREEQVAANDPARDDPNRQLLGAAQETWLFDTLSGSTAQWKVLGQQVMFGQYQGFTNMDAWDGYPAARSRILDHIAAEGISDVVVLTGDIHTSWAMDIAPNPYGAEYDPATGEGALAVEFVTPSVTSPGFPPAIADSAATAALNNNPHMRYVELKSKGYVIVELTPQSATGAWYYVEDVASPSGGATTFITAWSTLAGSSFLQSASEPGPVDDAPPLAP